MMCESASPASPSTWSLCSVNPRQLPLPVRSLENSRGTYLDLRCGINQTRRVFGFATFLPDLRRFKNKMRQNLLSFFPPPDLRRKSAGMRRECGGNRRECGGISRKANGVAAFLFWLRCVFLFAADFLECGGNFCRNALRQKFPPQEVLGIRVSFRVCFGFPVEKKNTKPGKRLPALRLEAAQDDLNTGIPVVGKRMEEHKRKVLKRYRTILESRQVPQTTPKNNA